MDLGIVAALVMLAGWAVAALAVDGTPGWIHLFLTAGVFLLIYRIVVRATPDAPKDAPAAEAATAIKSARVRKK